MNEGWKLLEWHEVYRTSFKNYLLEVSQETDGSWGWWCLEDWSGIKRRLKQESGFLAASAAMANAEVWLHDYQKREAQS